MKDVSLADAITLLRRAALQGDEAGIKVFLETVTFEAYRAGQVAGAEAMRERAAREAERIARSLKDWQPTRSEAETLAEFGHRVWVAVTALPVEEEGGWR